MGAVEASLDGRNVVSREAIEEAIQENMKEFDMNYEEAKKEAIEQFKLQSKRLNR